MDAADFNVSDPTTAQDRVWPAVSVIMPVLNEERHLAEAVAGVLAQEYPGEMELVLALGPSRDRTGEIARELEKTDERVRLVDNPAGRTPAGLNAALRAVRHGIVVRVDGHGVLSDHYVRTAVEVLENTGAANVGGIMLAEGRTDFERAVARAYVSPLGLGGGRFHVGGQPGPADTVYLGVFRRHVLERLGGFDEHFQRAQDWELNYRLRAAGESVWFTPDLTVSYRPRRNIRALAGQFLRTGQWRREVVRRYPDTASLRYLAAPVVTVAVTAGTVIGTAGVIAGMASGIAGAGWLLAGWLLPVGYLLGVGAGGLAIGGGLPVRARAWLPAVLATMHLSWGAGFIIGVRHNSVSQPVPAERPAT